MNKTNSDFGEDAAYKAGAGNDTIQCTFCEKKIHIDEAAPYPEYANNEIKRIYLFRPRCMECQTELHGPSARAARDAHKANHLFNSFLIWLQKPIEQRKEDEQKSLSEIFARLDRQAIAQVDADRLADEKGDGRIHTSRQQS